MFPATAQTALDEQVRFEAGIQGRMALAWLGRKWFDQGVAPGDENYLQARHRLDTFMVENAWWLSVAKVGEQVGQSVRRIPGEINRLMERSMTLADADAVATLVQADQLERDGCRRRTLTNYEGARILATPPSIFRHAELVGWGGCWRIIGMA